VRPASRAPDGYRSGRFAQTRAETLEWEDVEEIFLASRPRFVGLAFSILRNKEDAEDAVQDAFLSAYRHLRAFEGRSAFTTWFTRIVFNAALMVRRKRKPGWTDSLPETHSGDEISWPERIPDSQPDPEMVCAEKETFQMIDDLLENMSPVLRQAFALTYYYEISNAQAGALLGVTTGTFKSRLCRARQHLMIQAQRSLVAPIRRARHAPFSFSKDDFQVPAATPAEIPSPEMAFS
jgi:RNA polymerase sigma-70 factor (ECF subfamily)